MIKPNFQRLWFEFPDHTKYRSLKDLYTALGGSAANFGMESPTVNRVTTTTQPT
jgi:hypothetical protein